jgi:hypothetical protein
MELRATSRGASGRRVLSTPRSDADGPVQVVKRSDRSTAVAPSADRQRLGRPSARGQSRGSGRRDRHARKRKPEGASGHEQDAESAGAIREGSGGIQ